MNCSMQSEISNIDPAWTFRGEIFKIENFPKFAGFVYLITNKITGQKYIGRKYFSSMRMQKGKSRRKSISSDWEKYWSSSDILKKQVQELGKENFKREILALGKTKGDVNYLEVKYQFIFDVLESDLWLNENISGKYHRKPKHIVESRQVDLELLV